jgi:mRNA interferase MazF
MKRGDVVLVEFPFSDRAGSKLLTALMVQADAWNNVLDDTILASITSVARSPATEVELAVANEPQSELLMDSVVTCLNLITIDQKLIHRSRLSVGHHHAPNR